MMNDFSGHEHQFRTRSVCKNAQLDNVGELFHCTHNYMRSHMSKLALVSQRGAGEYLMIFGQDAVHVGHVLAGDLLHHQSAVVRGEEETLALPLALHRGTAGQRGLRDHTHKHQFHRKKKT